MEHITFKGTRDLPTTRDVSEAIEGVGGSCNAATDRESTVYWTRLPVREAERGLHVLAELTLRPQLRSEDIAREREIIVDEIRSYRDDPGQYVYNVWDEAFFGDSPLGWEIAGDEETVRALTDDDIRDFWAAALPALQPGRGGGRRHRSRGRRASSWSAPSAAVRAPGTTYAPAPGGPVERLRVVARRHRAGHLCLGVTGLPRDHADQWTLDLLNTVLGDGTSSRLFMSIREEAGLAYDVHSFQTDYADCGTLQVYLSVDAGDVRAGARGRPRRAVEAA